MEISFIISYGTARNAVQNQLIMKLMNIERVEFMVREKVDHKISEFVLEETLHVVFESS